MDQNDIAEAFRYHETELIVICVNSQIHDSEQLPTKLSPLARSRGLYTQLSSVVDVGTFGPLFPSVVAFAYPDCC